MKTQASPTMTRKISRKPSGNRGEVASANLWETALALVLKDYQKDGPFEPLEALSMDDHELQVNGEKMQNILTLAGAEKAAEILENLDPGIYLAYLASYCSNRRGDLVNHRQPLELIEDLIARCSKKRQSAITSLLERIANNLVNVGHACFDDPENKTHASLAAAIMRICCQRDDCAVSAFINGSIFESWAGNDEAAFDVANSGFKRFGFEPQLIANLLEFAEKNNRRDVLDQIVEKYLGHDSPELSEPVVLSLTSALFRQNQITKAISVMQRYLDEGDFSPAIMRNAVVIFRDEQAPLPLKHSVADRILDHVCRRRAIAKDAELVECLVALLVEIGRNADALTAINMVIQAKTPLTEQLEQFADRLRREITQKNGEHQ